MKPEHSRQILENIEITNFLKMRPVGVEQTDGQNDITKLQSIFTILRKHLKPGEPIG